MDRECRDEMEVRRAHRAVRRSGVISVSIPTATTLTHETPAFRCRHVERDLHFPEWRWGGHSFAFRRNVTRPFPTPNFHLLVVFSNPLDGDAAEFPPYLAASIPNLQQMPAPRQAPKNNGRSSPTRSKPRRWFWSRWPRGGSCVCSGAMHSPRSRIRLTGQGGGAPKVFGVEPCDLVFEAPRAVGGEETPVLAKGPRSSAARVCLSPVLDGVVARVRRATGAGRAGLPGLELGNGCQAFRSWCGV